MFKTIKANYSAEIVEKKSKFIANLFYVESIEEAEEKIKEIKKKYFDARHNCFAYRVATKDGITERFSDDGEPSGTAGGPMLTTLSGQNIANVLVIVTRYFGGILLGTGGLIRAYTSAVQEAIGKAEFVTKDMKAYDYTNYEIPLKKGDTVKEVFAYQDKVQIKKNGILGWTYRSNLE